jgi:hypothetical protein
MGPFRRVPWWVWAAGAGALVVIIVLAAVLVTRKAVALPPATANTVYHNGIFYWRVFPLDDFGTPGPGSPSWGASVVDQPRQV